MSLIKEKPSQENKMMDVLFSIDGSLKSIDSKITHMDGDTKKIATLFSLIASKLGISNPFDLMSVSNIMGNLKIGYPKFLKLRKFTDPIENKSGGHALYKFSEVTESYCKNIEEI